MSKMMNDKGKVIGIEHIKDLYNWGIDNMSKNHKNLIDNKTIELILGDGRLGYKKIMPLLNAYM
jgi:protein-L-isoaspartate(D-aspartate) O-methyltransferase